MQLTETVDVLYVLPWLQEYEQFGGVLSGLTISAPPEHIHTQNGNGK